MISSLPCLLGYRFREFSGWPGQLQGFLLGSLVGYVVGRLRAATPVDQKQQGDGQPRLPGR